jgi:cyclopropane fatty-acyl-phospholipid synthase-like methyltransferase
MTGHNAKAEDKANSHNHSHKNGHDFFHKRFDDAEKWSQKFDDPKRDQWQKPEAVINALPIKENSVVADIGSGTGYFATRLAKRHPNSKIIGVDVEPDMVAYLKKRADAEGLKNVESLLIPADSDVKLPEAVDLILVVDTYHHIPDREKYFKNLLQFLKPNGQLSIIDFKIDSPEGPPAEHRIQPDQIREELKSAGFEQTKSIDILPYQFFLMFKKTE